METVTSLRGLSAVDCRLTVMSAGIASSECGLCTGVLLLSLTTYNDLLSVHS